MQKISYVIPCYRSQHTVGGVVAEIAATMQTLPQYDYEVILVNDCSPDDTFGTIRSLVAADSHVVGVDLAKNFGQHAALMAGFHKCSGDIVVCLDDDGQTPADEVGKLLAKIDEGYDVVYASYDTKRQAGWRSAAIAQSVMAAASGGRRCQSSPANSISCAPKRWQT